MLPFQWDLSIFPGQGGAIKLSFPEEEKQAVLGPGGQTCKLLSLGPSLSNLASVSPFEVDQAPYPMLSPRGRAGNEAHCSYLTDCQLQSTQIPRVLGLASC